MAPESPSKAPGIGPALWAGLLLCLALGVGILFYAQGSSPDLSEVSEASFAFQPLRADTSRIESERTRLRGTKTYDTESIEALRELYRDANRAQFGTPDVAVLQELQKGMAFQAEEALLDTDVGGFIAAGRPIFEACEEGLAALLSDIQSQKISLDDAQRNPPEQAYEAYRRNCGNVLPFLRQTNLVDAQAKWTDPDSGPAVFGVLSRYRWAHLIDLRARPMAQLTPAERELLMRWRVEDTQAYPTAKRREFLKQADAELEGYPALLAEGRLAIESGDWEAGLRHWEKACAASPGDAALRAQCDWLRAKVGSQGSGPAVE